MLLSSALCRAIVVLGFVGSVTSRAISKESKRAAPQGVPEYVLQYAPLVHLYSSDPYRPSSIQAQLEHTTPQVDFQPVGGAPSPLTLDNLDQLNGLGGSDIYLTSNDDITTSPEWLRGEQPDQDGATPSVSSVVVVNDKGTGIVDAFYFIFYAYNYGGKVLGINLGNHVGDWEHNMVRFENGTPTAVWYSQHADGEAFAYQTVEKEGVRPVGYVAGGTHAVYAITGTHDHTIPDLNLPGGLIEDHTDKGPAYDPVANAYFYSFNAADGSFTPYDDTTPVAFMNYDGQWGDEQYPDDDDRQFKFFGFARYTGGPNGPKFKELNREEMCPDNGTPCFIRHILGP